MRYDLTIPLKDLSGVQMTDGTDTVGYTLRSVLVRTALFVDKTNLPTVVEKLEAYALAKRIATAGHTVDLTPGEVDWLRRQSGAMWSPLVMGQLWELLEQPIQLASPPGKPAADIPSA